MTTVNVIDSKSSFFRTYLTKNRNHLRFLPLTVGNNKAGDTKSNSRTPALFPRCRCLRRISATVVKTRATQMSLVTSCRHPYLQTYNPVESVKIRDPRQDIRTINRAITATAGLALQTIVAFTTTVENTHGKRKNKNVADGHLAE